MSMPCRAGIKEKKRAPLTVPLPSSYYLKVFHRGPQPQQVTVHPEAGDLPDHRLGDQRALAEFFPLMDVGDMDLDGRNPHRRQGVPQGNAGMGIGRGIDNEGAELFGRLLNPADHLSLTVRLTDLHLHLELFRQGADLAVDLFQRQPTVDLRLSLTE